MKLIDRTAAQRRRRFCASLAVVAAGLGSTGALAYACTGGGGDVTNLSATVGNANQSLLETTSATGSSLSPAPPGKLYYFRYAYPNDPTACHHEAGIGAGVNETGGNIAAVKRTIPSLGAHVAGKTGEACWSVITVPMQSRYIAADAAITVN